MDRRIEHRAGIQRALKALLFTSCVSLSLPHPADAAEAAAPAAVDVSEVVVTGTSIRGVAPVGSTLTTVGRDDLKASGAISTVELLNKTPQIFNIGVSEASRGQTGGSSNITYGSSVNIRGISPYATLTMLDGFRVVPQGPRAEAVDPGHIPTNMLQRVEIVADGGSAIYGSDAIAGVANLILRRRAEGVEVGLRYGRSNLGYENRSAQITVGHVWDSGQFTAGIEYAFHNSILQSKLSYDVRDQRPLGGTDIRSSNCQPGNITVGTTTYAIPAGGVTAATANLLVPGTVNKCDYYRLADANPMQERRSGAFTFNQNITDSIHLDAEGYASRRNFKLVVVPTALSLVVPSTNAFYVAPVGVTVPLCTAATAALYGIPATSRCLNVLYNNINDVGVDRALYGYSQVYQVIAGGSVDLPGKWQANLHQTYGFSQDKNFDRSDERFNAVNQNIAVASSNPATALNVFGGRSDPSVVSNITPNGLYNQLFDTGGHTILGVTDLKFDGPVWELPGGTIRAAAGYQYYRLTWWSNNKTGPLTAPVVLTPQHVVRTHDSYFAEINIPIIGEGNALPLVKALEVNVAGRVDAYSDVGRTTNPKYGFRWTPTDGLVIHGSYGTSFRSPNILDLYQSSLNINAQTLFDPTCGGTNTPGGCNVAALGLTGGNPNIKPETAKTYSLGFDFNPSFLPNLSVSVNYFQLRLEGQIAAFLADTAILSKEAQLAGTGVITRVTSAAQADAVLAVHVVTSGALPADHSLIKAIIDGRPLNLGATETAGYDVTANYRISTDNYGSGVVGLTGELFTKYADQSTPASAQVDRLNFIFFPPKWRARYYAGWNYGQLSGMVTVNYLNSYTNTLITPFQTVKASATVDLHAAWEVKSDNHLLSGLTLGLDVTNLFDHDPPTVLGQGTGVFGTGGTSNFGGAGFNPTNSYIFGRLIAFTIDKSF